MTPSSDKVCFDSDPRLCLTNKSIQVVSMSANVLHYHVTAPAIVRSGPGVEKLKVVIHQRSFLLSCVVEHRQRVVLARRKPCFCSVNDTNMNEVFMCENCNSMMSKVISSRIHSIMKCFKCVGVKKTLLLIISVIRCKSVTCLHSTATAECVTKILLISFNLHHS